MNRDSFRQSIFAVVEQLTQSPLSSQGKELLLHYFNASHADTSRGRAVEAINKYFPESGLDLFECPPKIERAVEKMYAEADAWDRY